jgi:nitrite reductase/ring-hydroxylating ferredoxin subunit
LLHYKTKTKWYKIFDSLETAEAEISPLELKAITIGGKKICIVRTSEGFFGIADRCPHQGGPLSEGICTEYGTVICPWHQYEFDLKTGRDRTTRGHHAKLFPVAVREDGVYIGEEKGYWTLFNR